MMSQPGTINKGDYLRTLNYNRRYGVTGRQGISYRCNIRYDPKQT